jgi:hypothetical protein
MSVQPVSIRMRFRPGGDQGGFGFALAGAEVVGVFAANWVASEFGNASVAPIVAIAFLLGLLLPALKATDSRANDVNLTSSGRYQGHRRYHRRSPCRLPRGDADGLEALDDQHRPEACEQNAEDAASDGPDLLGD